MLRRIELEVLASVERGDSISELARKLDYSESYLSRAVADLGEKGLVYTERDGRRKRVVPCKLPSPTPSALTRLGP